jgi:hypothetical protein
MQNIKAKNVCVFTDPNVRIPAFAIVAPVCVHQWPQMQFLLLLFF